MRSAKLFLLVLLIGISALGTSAGADTLTILHVNDSHSHLLPYGPRDAAGNHTLGGMARLATMIGMQRMTEPNVLLFHSGDFFVGDFMFQKYLGIAELEIMKALDFDALELGNHEFDLYPQTLAYVLSQAGFPQNGFPLLCANLDLSGYPDLGYFVRPYIVMDIGATRVGVFGLLTDMANQISNPAPVTVLPPIPAAAIWIDSLRNGHSCDIVILLSHLGIDTDQLLASTIPGIDIILGGHSHTEINQPILIGGTLIVQAKEFYRYLGKLKIVVTGGDIQSWNYELLPIDSSVPPEPTLEAMINTLVAGVEIDPRFGPVYSQMIAQAGCDIKKELGDGICRDNGLGALVAEALRTAAGTDIAFQPQGFISQTLFAGALSGSDIFQAVPYGFDQISGLGFKMATFELNGLSIIAGLEFSVYNMPYMEDFFLHCSNLAYAYNSADDPGSRIKYSSLRVGGRLLNPFATYSVAVPEGVIPFLSQIPGFQMDNLVITDQFIYDVVKNYIVANSPVVFYSDGRAMDLALLNPPVDGTVKLSDVVRLFGQNGFINDAAAVDNLCNQLRITRYYLGRDRELAAILSLYAFKAKVRFYQLRRNIDAVGAGRLILLADQLIDNIIPGFPKESATEVAETEPIPQQFILMQNYPNPFNPSTEITYYLPQDSRTTLAIYDIAGREVRVLADEYQEAGIHSISWDGRDRNGCHVASGVYFYRLKAGDFAETKKMSIVR